ncbi:MAG: recombination-associated protein RdgC [bacterium]|nr:recombination-associated protein RdgC [Candidatus Sumerlaeota bacterium]
MGLINGSVTYTKFRVEEKLPKDFTDSLNTQLARHAFRDIDPKKNPEYSIGWVNAFNPLDTHLKIEKTLFGKYLVLGMRIDRKRLPPALLKARLTNAMRALAREKRVRKLSREDITGLKETLRAEMLASAGALTALFDAAWNYEAGEVYFSSASRKASEDFAELFGQTFELTLTAQNLVARAERIIDDIGSDAELATMQPAHFGR